MSDLIDISDYSKLELSGIEVIGVYDANRTTITPPITPQSSNKTPVVYTFDSSVKYIRVAGQTAGLDAGSAYVREPGYTMPDLVLTEAQMAVDDTLSIEGAAADAKTVGDKLDDTKNIFTSLCIDVMKGINTDIYSDLIDGYVKTDGGIATSPSYKRTDYIEVAEGDRLYLWRGNEEKIVSYTIAPYDSTKTVNVSGIIVNNQTYTVPSGVKYVIMSTQASYVSNECYLYHEMMVSCPDETLTQSGKAADAKATGDAIKASQPTPTANILPGESEYPGIWLNNVSGHLYETSNASYNSTGIIEIIIGHTYKLVAKEGFDTSFALYGSEFSDGVQTSGCVPLDSTIRIGDEFTATKNNIRFSYYSSLESHLVNVALVDKAVTTEYVRYGVQAYEHEVFGDYQINQIEEISAVNFLQPFRGKKILSLGDSYTWLNYYGKYLAETTGCTQRGRGQNGNVLKSFCNDSYTGPDGNTVYEVFDENLLDDYDIVTIMGGTNDYGHGSATLGAITDDTSADTIYGAVKYLINKILSIKPTVKIFFCTQPYRLQYSTETAPGGYEANANGLTMANIADAIIKACAHWGIPCFDFYSCSGWNPWTVYKENDEVVDNPYTYDGLHPKDGDGNGADQIGRAFGAFINAHY